MTKEYETIIEKVLEAKDEGVSLATLLEQHPEKKGGYSDAWKFVESVNDHINQGKLPDKDRFLNMLNSIPESRPVLSRYMPYIAFATPALLLLIVVFSQTSLTTEKDTLTQVSLYQEAPQEASLDALTSAMSDQQNEIGGMMPMMKNSQLSSGDSSVFDTSLISLENAYALEASTEKESVLSLADSTNYDNLAALYE